MVRVQLVQVQL